MRIIDRRTKLKARRLVRNQKRQVESLTTQADQDLNRLFFRRLARLAKVRRFVALWSVFVLLLGFGAMWQVQGLDKHYLTLAPSAGGTYREGILGSFTNANPLFATSSVDVSVSRLVFSGLFKISPSGEVVGDLATEFTADDKGTLYTVTLRDNVRWHDGELFDADDVLFTYQTIQDDAARSPLFSSWRGVNVAKVDQTTVTFELPSPLSSFPYSLINGIVPEHILSSVDATNLRSSDFNTLNPVGTGPFTLDTLEVVGTDRETRQERIALAQYPGHHASVPLIDSIVITSYRTEEAMQRDFDSQVIMSMIGLTSISDQLQEREGVRVVSSPLTSAVMAFFNISTPILKDQKVRQALAQATDVDVVRQTLTYNTVPAMGPLLRSQFAYDPDRVQLPYDPAKAAALLDEAGWTLDTDGDRAKDGQKLQLRLVSQSLSEYASVTQELQKQWGELGVTVEAVLQPEEDIQAVAIARHDYDVLLYGISIGHDPDVFAYWHSSQADPRSTNRLNLSEYKNDQADEALESGRTRLDEDLRKIKYQPFLDAWARDVPALALYQPRFLMVVQGTFEGFEMGELTTTADRYWSVSNWQVRNTQVVK